MTFLPASLFLGVFHKCSTSVPRKFKGRSEIFSDRAKQERIALCGPLPLI